MDAAAHRRIGERKLFVKGIMRSCTLCPRRCGVDRIAGEKGYCGLDASAYCFREMVHPSEEAELVPSHQVYYAGCNLRCGYCTVAEWNEEPWDCEAIATAELARRIEKRRADGAKTLNFLGGEPTVSLYGILDVLQRLDPEYTVVWNSNMYFGDAVHEALEGLADVFLADVKCGCAACGEAMLDAADYFEVAKEAVKRAAAYSDVIVRYLAVPGHVECCGGPVLEWLARELPGVKVSLRLDYVPPVESEGCPTVGLSGRERRRVVGMAKDLKLNLIQ